ncbi:hypothetical protein J7E45_14005 [Microbacterium sp. ISL-59]|uniref:hypothetical protein n=1 Tax=Microbacterium sp. ISL-59 TaxID=2819159 RepID=UPI001BE8940B|nr:hypothetical protein [Microbacterium sp. ISL-59]MBT2496722.1 hypothetical protein [Microbacterium sp. ISL-59]
MTVRWEERPSAQITVQTARGGFSVWPDDLEKVNVIVVRALGVALATQGGERDYDALLERALSPGVPTAHAAFDGSEDSYDAAAERTRRLNGPTWLGLSRDFRIFNLGFAGIGAGRLGERILNWITPQRHTFGVKLDELDSAVDYKYLIGRGAGAQHDVRRSLLEGSLPIVLAEILDGSIRYDVTMFAGLEKSDLTPATNLGTDYLIADVHSSGHMLTAEQRDTFDERWARHAPAEETVMYVRVRATNTSSAPRHAFVTAPGPYVGDEYGVRDFEFADGFSLFSADRVFAAVSIGGEPARDEEMKPLLLPGESVDIDLYVVHSPVSAERAAALQARRFEDVLETTAAFWRARLQTAATIRVPDQRITDMVSAGALHLDIIAYGEEPDGPVAATIGTYPPIGSESAPIIQFFDSIGWSNLAARSLRYFEEKQHDDGFMQNFNGYMLETEAALWSFGEHFRYTKDLDALRRSRPAIEGAVGYILERRRVQRAAGVPHGLITGKAADPEDDFAGYMLNGFAYLGLARAAEVMRELDPELASGWQAAADELRQDIRASLDHWMSQSPVVPLADGTWSRTVPPWAGQPGPVVLDRTGGRYLTHGTVTTRDALIGPMWLNMQEVIDPQEQVATEMLEYSADLLMHDNAALSQPYYSPHLYTNLRRGEVGAFLRGYFTMLTSLADRETYSFWEHYFHASPHKTHEEAWFLMQTRWMLYLEIENRLTLFSGVPRAWLSAGENIRLTGVRSYFGAMDVELTVSSDGDRAHLTVDLDEQRLPAELFVRLPHADGPRSADVSCGVYDEASETVRIDAPTRHVELEIRWGTKAPVSVR